MTFERSKRRTVSLILVFITGILGLVVFFNFRSLALNDMHSSASNVHAADVSPVSDVYTDEVKTVLDQETGLPSCNVPYGELMSIVDDEPYTSCIFKDNELGDLIWEAAEYPLPSQHIVQAIENNLIDETQRTLLLAVVNHGMLEYTLNWIESLRRTQIEKYLVFAIDQELVDALTERGLGEHVVLIPDEWRHVEISGDFAKWKSTTYVPITHAKTLIVERLLYMGITVWFSDVDIVFLNPTIYNHILWNMKNRKDVHMVFQQETRQTSINSGFYLMRPTLVTKRILGRTIDLQDRHGNLTQQRVMNLVLSDMNQDYRNSPMLLLDFMQFPNGNIYFGAKLPTKLGFEPMMVHANYR
ncbi:hypothetical protein K450DRAFT_197845 [Umbelopsis ramanniana AG]|uniref:Nucleotide-diphospho-sugar transferase domain-containing protein n=1 Tax=Umbelopsis ramanniana AG TaxID=1314678 RepID=A0AAD5EDP4_UMBRA|nr:uncharacterized protein K450DRAFT_197845 [Umbelopsis ramanniana AG]KAI8581412.1 hypothetical protein K450DRAFT_197845 [Umbelopsis ramanniana AG]